MDLNGRSSNISPVGNHLLLIGLFEDSSLQQSRFFYVPGSMALRGAFNCFSKYAGALLFRLGSGSHSKCNRTISCHSWSHAKCLASGKDSFTGLHVGSGPTSEYTMPMLFSKIASSMMSRLSKELEQIQSFPLFSLATALALPLKKLSHNTPDIQPKETNPQINVHMDQLACVSKPQVCGDFSVPAMNLMGHTSEAATGIEFPKSLSYSLTGANNSNLSSEILVGTGSRSMKILRIKTLRVYAFGLYVQPASICQKLGPKYGSMPISELSSQPEFFEDLLKSDIDMTVRLVVNFNGLKVSAVRDTFERSLRTRLSKVNPEADHHCLRAFASYFTEDIPLPAGTTIDFRQTAKGQLITKIGGKQIGTVDSKDLCRAFFDMYIGDVSVSVQSKEEITRNVGTIIRKC